MPVESLRWQHLGPQSRFAVLGVLAAGCAALISGLNQWSNVDLGLFLGYLIVATAAAVLRIELPDKPGALSLHFFFVLICISQLSLPETLLIAAAGTLLQGIVYYKPVRLLPTALQLAITILAAWTATLAYFGLAQGAADDQSPLLLVVAAGILFLFHTLPAAIVIGLAEDRNPWLVWRDTSFWTFPHYVAGGGAAGLLSLLGHRPGWEAGLLIVPILYWMYNNYRYYLQRLQDEQRQLRDLSGLHFRTIEALALAIEGHDPTKHGHLRRVSIYVTELGREMGLSDPELQALHAAAMLHDIGKLAVPEHIITKPGKLTDVEFERIKVHPVAGAEILEQVQFPYPVAPVVRAHHERWDGAGYPSGLKGTDIPVGARILSAVDCLDALISDRYHRRALTLEQAMDYLRGESGKSFDPEVVRLLSLRYRELEQKVLDAQQHDLRIGGLAATSHGASAKASDLSQRARAAQAASSGFLTRIAAARQEEQQFFQLARELGNSLSLEKTLEACATRLEAMCPFDAIAIYMLRDRTLSADFVGGAFNSEFGGVQVAWGQVVTGRVAEQGSPILNGDPSAELTGPASAELHSAMAVSIDGVADRIGVITLYSRSRDAFTVDQLRVLTGVASRAAAPIENALKYSRAEQSATTDPLTGLANARSLFLHLDGELARAKRHNDSVTVLVCDLDRFKQLNDLHGHMEGNRTLKLIAQALKKQCREYDFVARMGGDEFVVVLPSHRLTSVEAKIEHLRHSVHLAASEVAGAVGLGMSVGHASYPEDGEDAEALLATADRRMYRMKQQNVTRAAEAAADELRKLGENLGPRSTIH